VVKQSFERTWKGYREKAWLEDELLPISGGSRDVLGWWAATSVDSLDTLLIMNLTSEFTLAVKAIEKIDFGYTEDEEINVFDTTIRYLGGLLAAHDLCSGITKLKKEKQVLLKRAIELEVFLLAAFDTVMKMPITRWAWRGWFP